MSLFTSVLAQAMLGDLSCCAELQSSSCARSPGHRHWHENTMHEIKKTSNRSIVHHYAETKAPVSNVVPVCTSCIIPTLYLPTHIGH
ncbi:hypothetical protein HD554DRAFT_1006712 [Boletus coccyginus]|nr:hypothetical protein HD554DRAFT_1006712 [Boletus coccyginus]